tara:strand:+ start:1215 stop:1334 length:120 start_codon:yes stop_codon:yes gene_type:complete
MVEERFSIRTQLGFCFGKPIGKEARFTHQSFCVLAQNIS